jgi:hypothetical protein
MRIDGWGMWHVWERTEMYSGFWRGDLTEGDHTIDLKDTVRDSMNWTEQAQYTEK